ncbi:MAG: hypothetical protein ACSHYC_00025 [Alphaproteobacteria bacterium]
MKIQGIPLAAAILVPTQAGKAESGIVFSSYLDCQQAVLLFCTIPRTNGAGDIGISSK